MRLLRSDFHRDSAVADEVGELVEHRLSAHLKLLRAVRVGAAEDKIQEGLSSFDHCMKRFSLSLIPPHRLAFAPFAIQPLDRNA